MNKLIIALVFMLALAFAATTPYMFAPPMIFNAIDDEDGNQKLVDIGARRGR